MSYDDISPTAATIAYVRGFGPAVRGRSPFAARIAQLADAEEATMTFYHRPDFDIDLTRMQKLRPWAELRQQALREMLRRTGVDKVFELGSGLSTMSLDILKDEATPSHFRYLETDLPEMIEYKERLVREMFVPFPPSNLLFAPVDVLDQAQLLAAARRHLSGLSSLAVVHEGLFQYLTHNEKKQVALNIRVVLEKHHGLWMTTDIVRKKDFLNAFEGSAYMRRIHEILTENTGRDMAELAFDSFDEAEDLFSSAGFRVKRYEQMDLSKSTAHIERLPTSRDHARHQLWVMRLKE